MVDLLKRWAKLEPNRCANVHRHPGIYLVSGSYEIGRNVWASKVSLSDAGHVLAAVIEAIEAHEWEWSLWGDGHEIEASVVRPVYVDEETLRRERHDTGLLTDTAPPAALLSAYLAALEATQ